jgi:hypothetical protein
MQSDYMYWAKHQQPVAYPLSSSEVPHFHLDRLPVTIAGLELDGASRYRYPPLREAIARKRAVAARYNGNLIKLAPHLLFERRGDLFVSALNLSKNWPADAERRLGQFKLAGLIGTELLEESFDPFPSFQASAPRADDTLILAI